MYLLCIYLCCVLVLWGVYFDMYVTYIHTITNQNPTNPTNPKTQHKTALLQIGLREANRPDPSLYLSPTNQPPSTHTYLYTCIHNMTD